MSKDEPPVTESTPKKRIRRRGKKAKSTKNYYFHAGTQAAIVDYQQTDNLKKKEQLYVTEIMPAFEKLAENLINIHKFSGLHDSYDDLKNDCVNFLFETIGKFDPTRGTNAFSYFNVVAKRWLIIRSKKKTQVSKRNISIDDGESISAHDTKLIEDHNIVPSQEQMLENHSTAVAIIDLLYEIRTRVKSENELACINSIITIFENIDDIDLLNKSAVLLYMRELSGLSPKQLITTMQGIKRQYRIFKLDPKFNLLD